MIEQTTILGTQNKKGTEDDDELITDLVDQVFHEAKEATQEKLWEGIAKNLLLDKLTWFIAIPCITALVAFGIIAMKS
jgi:hypothetical protein